MGQEDGEKWTAAADLQPTFPKSDRLLAISLLPVFQESNRPVDISPLRLLVAAADQQHNLLANLRLMDTVSGPEINSQLADAVSQILAIPKQSSLDASDTLDHGGLRHMVTQAVKPILVEIVPVLV